jgi:hypothetical protein
VIHNNEGKSWQYALQYHPQDYAQSDGVDLHPYPTNPPKEGVESRTAEIETNSKTWPEKALGHAVQCWVGECGMSTWTPSDPKKVHFTPVSEPFQAACQVRTVVQGLAAGVKAWCIYDFLNESANPNDVESNFGLVKDITHNYELKPAFYSLQRLARLLGPDWQTLDIKAPIDVQLPAPDPALVDPKRATGPVAYWFKVGSNYITIVWKAGGESNFDAPAALGKITLPKDGPIPSNATAEAVDLVTGKNVDVKLDAGANGATLSGVPVGWAPVAIRWTAAK